MLRIVPFLVLLCTLAGPSVAQNAPPCFDATRACCARNGQRQHAPEFVYISTTSQDLGNVHAPATRTGRFEGLNVSDEYVRVYDISTIASGLNARPSKDVIAPGDTFSIYFDVSYAAHTGQVQAVISVRVGPKDPPEEDLTACRTHTPYQTFALTLRATLSQTGPLPTPPAQGLGRQSPTETWRAQNTTNLPANGVCEVSTQRIQLGTVQPGTEVPFAFTVRNGGNVPLALDPPHAPATAIRFTNPAPGTLSPGAAYEIRGVLLVPAAPEEPYLNPIVVLNSNDADQPTQRIRISATVATVATAGR